MSLLLLILLQQVSVAKGIKLRERYRAEDEDVSKEKSDNLDYYDDDEYNYSDDDYDSNDEYDDSIDYETIHSKVPFHNSQISYKEAIYLPSLYRASGKQDKTILQVNKLRDIFLAIRRQCGGGKRGGGTGFCQYFF